jgi:hypothetical protein
MIQHFAVLAHGGGKTKKTQKKNNKMKSKRDGHTNGCRRDFA